MVDISKLGGSTKGVPFSEFGNSLAVSAAGMPNASKAMREALGCERLGTAVGELSTIDKAIKDAMVDVSKLGGYSTKGTHFPEFDNSLAEAAAKMPNVSKAMRE